MKDPKITRIEFEHNGDKLVIESFRGESSGITHTLVSCEDFSLEALEEAIRIFKQTRKEEK